MWQGHFPNLQYLERDVPTLNQRSRNFKDILLRLIANRQGWFAERHVLMNRAYFTSVGGHLYFLWDHYYCCNQKLGTSRMLTCKQQHNQQHMQFKGRFMYNTSLPKLSNILNSQGRMLLQHILAQQSDFSEMWYNLFPAPSNTSYWFVDSQPTIAWKNIQIVESTIYRANIYGVIVPSNNSTFCLTMTALMCRRGSKPGGHSGFGCRRGSEKFSSRFNEFPPDRNVLEWIVGV